MGLFANIITPCIPHLVDMWEYGIPLDIELRNKLREETQLILEEAKEAIAKETGEYHKRRVWLIEEAISGLEEKLRASVAGEDGGAIDGGDGDATRCTKHPDYRGITKRQKCEACREVFSGAEGLRAQVKDLRSRAAKGRAVLKRIGPHFQATNDNHWRWLLFAKGGLGLAPVSRTGVKREPKVDDDAMDKLTKKHPDIELLKLRVISKQAASRLANRLSVEPGPDGRVHFAYSLHRAPGRLSSGAESDEDGKSRMSAGNAQNITEADRRMYVAEPGNILVAFDWSQIEARVMAWLGDNRKMLRAWRDGADIHALNGAAFARSMGHPDATPEDSRRLTMRFGGQDRTFRYCAKRATHGWNYGMAAGLTSELYGIDLATAARLRQSYFDQWPQLVRFQRAEITKAFDFHRNVNPFGRVARFYTQVSRKTGEQELIDRNWALAFRPQSTVSDMLKALIPAMAQLYLNRGGRLLTTTHDSYVGQVPVATNLDAFVIMAKGILEQVWPELKTNEEFGMFSCPADAKYGKNWSEQSEENPEGLRELGVL